VLSHIVVEVSVSIQFRGQPCLLTGPERHREFLRDEYKKVSTQYRAIENLDARKAFFEERQQLVKRIEEVTMFFSLKIISAHARTC
jgi:hypothetical protein